MGGQSAAGAAQRRHPELPGVPGHRLPGLPAARRGRRSVPRHVRAQLPVRASPEVVLEFQCMIPWKCEVQTVRVTEHPLEAAVECGQRISMRCDASLFLGANPRTLL